MIEGALYRFYCISVICFICQFQSAYSQAVPSNSIQTKVDLEAIIFDEKDLSHDFSTVRIVYYAEVISSNQEYLKKGDLVCFEEKSDRVIEMDTNGVILAESSNKYKLGNTFQLQLVLQGADRVQNPKEKGTLPLYSLRNSPIDLTSFSLSDGYWITTDSINDWSFAFSFKELLLTDTLKLERQHYGIHYYNGVTYYFQESNSNFRTCIGHAPAEPVDSKSTGEIDMFRIECSDSIYATKEWKYDLESKNVFLYLKRENDSSRSATIIYRVIIVDPDTVMLVRQDDGLLIPMDLKDKNERHSGFQSDMFDSGIVEKETPGFYLELPCTECENVPCPLFGNKKCTYDQSFYSELLTEFSIDTVYNADSTDQRFILGVFDDFHKAIESRKRLLTEGYQFSSICLKAHGGRVLILQEPDFNGESEYINELIQGDFNGDGVNDYFSQIRLEAWPFLYWSDRIYFNQKELPEIKTPKWIVGNVYNEGDLDGDGADELSIHIVDWRKLRQPFCYGNDLLILTFKNNQWKYLIPPVAWSGVHTQNTVRKHPEKSNWIQIETTNRNCATTIDVPEDFQITVQTEFITVTDPREDEFAKLLPKHSSINDSKLEDSVLIGTWQCVDLEWSGNTSISEDLLYEWKSNCNLNTYRFNDTRTYYFYKNDSIVERGTWEIEKSEKNLVLTNEHSENPDRCKVRYIDNDKIKMYSSDNYLPNLIFTYRKKE